MADNKPQDDLSIEEILGSIRRIIAEDDEPEATVIEAQEENEDETVSSVSESVIDEPAEDEEPLELTNKIEEDGSIIDVNASDEIITPNPVGAEPLEPEQIDFVEEKPPLAEQPEPKTYDEKIVLVEESDTMAMQDEDMTPPEALVSTSTAEATSAVMAKLARHTALLEEGQNSGVTVEGMVREILKPMLKDWLDDNLPELVQKMVEREIERLTKHL